jgi:DNA-binding GntR family transcriptional regulator
MAPRATTSVPLPRGKRPRTYLADRVYEALRRDILEREFDPGEPLTEHDLSRRYGVSRTPVREALAKLERDRLVRVVPKKGAFVRTASHDDVRELYQIREALEMLAVRLAAPRLDRAELAAFEARLRHLQARGAKVDYTDVRAVGEEFHAFLVQQAGNVRLREAIEQIRQQLRAVWTMSVLAPRRVQALVREHLSIIDALQRSDARRAERLMADHVRRVRESIFRLLD